MDNSLAVPNLMNVGDMPLTTSCPLTSQYATALRMADIPNVAMIGSTRSTVTVKALMAPMVAPPMSAMTTASTPPRCADACSHPTKLIENDMLAATDRSNTPLISEMTSASVRMPTIAWLPDRMRAFDAVRNCGSVRQNAKVRITIKYRPPNRGR